MNKINIEICNYNNIDVSLTDRKTELHESENNPDKESEHSCGHTLNNMIESEIVSQNIVEDTS